MTTKDFKTKLEYRALVSLPYCGFHQECIKLESPDIHSICKKIGIEVTSATPQEEREAHSRALRFSETTNGTQEEFYKEFKKTTEPVRHHIFVDKQRRKPWAPAGSTMARNCNDLIDEIVRAANKKQQKYQKYKEKNFEKIGLYIYCRPKDDQLDIIKDKLKDFSFDFYILYTEGNKIFVITDKINEYDLTPDAVNKIIASADCKMKA